MRSLLDELPDELESQAFSHASWVEDRATSYERLARRGEIVAYEVTAESGPPHERIFEVAAVVAGDTVAHGSGRSKKEAEQAAAAAALEAEVEA